MKRLLPYLWCLLAVAAVQCAVARARMPAGDLAGPRTGVLYVSATSYAAANRRFLEEERSTTLHFPYTAPSAVPGEVAIEFGIRGPFVVLTGGATTTLESRLYASSLERRSTGRVPQGSGRSAHQTSPRCIPGQILQGINGQNILPSELLVSLRIVLVPANVLFDLFPFIRRTQSILNNAPNQGAPIRLPLTKPSLRGLDQVIRNSNCYPR